jgi:hypothetical protein
MAARACITVDCADSYGKFNSVKLVRANSALSAASSNAFNIKKYFCDLVIAPGNQLGAAKSRQFFPSPVMGGQSDVVIAAKKLHVADVECV